MPLSVPATMEQRPSVEQVALAWLRESARRAAVIGFWLGAVIVVTATTFSLLTLPAPVFWTGCSGNWMPAIDLPLPLILVGCGVSAAALLWGVLRFRRGARRQAFGALLVAGLLSANLFGGEGYDVCTMKVLRRSGPWGLSLEVVSTPPD